MGPSETDYDPLLADGRLAIETSISKHRDNQGRCSWHKITWGVLICITLLSVYGFLFTTTRQTTLTEERAKLISEISRLKSQQSRFASLAEEIDSTYYAKTPYADADNPDTTDALWRSINIDAGIVALPDSYVKANNLPSGVEFPWDDSKSVYILNGYHHLHCLKSIYFTIRAFQTSTPQARTNWHWAHCLDELRREILCKADDTPRASNRELAPNTGVGQARTCRSWDKLEAWAGEYNACFHAVPFNETDDWLDRYKFCPEGSPYKGLYTEYKHGSVEDRRE